MPKIRKPDVLPVQYLHVYWANWWAMLTKRSPKYPDALMNCVGCGAEGLIGFELKHRGETRRTNLLCNICWSNDRADTEEGAGRSTLGKAGRVLRHGPRDVGVPGRRLKGRD